MPPLSYFTDSTACEPALSSEGPQNQNLSSTELKQRKCGQPEPFTSERSFNEGATVPRLNKDKQIGIPLCFLLAHHPTP